MTYLVIYLTNDNVLIVEGCFIGPRVIRKFGKCPINTDTNVAYVGDVYVDECGKDGDCPGTERYCKQGCYTLCQNPDKITLA